MLPCQKSQFSIPDGVHYLNCAYMGPLSVRTQEAGIAGVLRKGNPAAISADDFFRDSDDLRRLFARMINAPDPLRIAIIPAASYGVATAAANASRRAHDNIVVAAEQFPSNVYSWRALAESGGELRTVEAPPGPGRAAAWNQRILEAIDASTSIVALPHVHWTDGSRFDLERIGQRAREVGALFVVDGTQSIGALPFDVQRIGADVVVCAGYKWLLGPYSIGCVYYGDRFDNGVPLEQNWITRAGSEDFAGLVDYAHDYQPGALRYDVGERSNFILVPMLVAALEQALAWDAARIQQYCGTLTRDLLEEAPDLGFTVEQENWRGAHLFGLRAPAGRDMDRVQRRLQDASVYVSRRGSALRISPNVYNDEADLAVLRQVLRDAI